MIRNVAHVSITSDMWTSDSNKSYITGTVHFIYDHKIISRVIATREVILSHTGENIANELRAIFEEWTILNKVVTVVTDNGANIKNAINEHLKMYHHPCVAHNLNLTVNEILKCNEELIGLLKKCRSLVGHFKHSVSATNKLKEVQEQLNMPVLKVMQDVPTRWNSCYLMLQRLFEIKDALSVTVTNLSAKIEFLRSDDWKLLKDCLVILKPAYDLTNIFSAEKYVTMSLIIPLIRGFQVTLKT